MQAHPVFAARDLGRIGAPAHDGAHDHRVAQCFRSGRDDDAVAETKPGVGGEPLVYRYGTLPAENWRRGDEQKERELQRRADELQCAVSFSASRVSASVYDGAL